MSIIETYHSGFNLDYVTDADIEKINKLMKKHGVQGVASESTITLDEDAYPNVSDREILFNTDDYLDVDFDDEVFPPAFVLALMELLHSCLKRHHSVRFNHFLTELKYEGREVSWDPDGEPGDRGKAPYKADFKVVLGL